MNFRESLQTGKIIKKESGDILYVNFKNLETKYIETFLQNKKNEIDEILNNLEQKKGMKYHLELPNQKEKEKELHNYDTFKKEEGLVFDTDLNDKKIDLDNYIGKLIIIKSNIKNFLFEQYNIIFKFNDREDSIIEKYISEKINERGGKIESKELSKLIYDHFLDNLYNFLYIYESKINELHTNPNNLIILEKIGETFKLQTEQKPEGMIEEEMNIYINSKQHKKLEEEYKNGLELPKEVKKIKKYPNYLKIRKNPLAKKEDEEIIVKGISQQEELDILKKSIDPDDLKKIKEIASLPSKLKDIQRVLNHKR